MFAAYSRTSVDSLSLPPKLLCPQVGLRGGPRTLAFLRQALPPLPGSQREGANDLLRRRPVQAWVSEAHAVHTGAVARARACDEQTRAD